MVKGFSCVAEKLDDLFHVAEKLWDPSGIDVHMAHITPTRLKAHDFGPAQARHGPLLTVPMHARPVYCARAWTATLARRAAQPRPDFENWTNNSPLTWVPV
jgi:hypothetical protein